MPKGTRGEGFSVARGWRVTKVLTSKGTQGHEGHSVEKNTGLGVAKAQLRLEGVSQ